MEKTHPGGHSKCSSFGYVDQHKSFNHCARTFSRVLISTVQNAVYLAGRDQSIRSLGDPVKQCDSVYASTSAQTQRNEREVSAAGDEREARRTTHFLPPLCAHGVFS